MGPEGIRSSSRLGPAAAGLRRAGEIRTSYPHFLSILAGYDKKGVNPLGFTIESYVVRPLVD